MKKTLSLILAVMMIISVIPVMTFAADEPIPIGYPDELANISSNLSGNYILTRDIDLNNSTWSPIGGSTAFSGTLEGNGKKITGLNVNITSSDTTVYAGLFGNVTGTVKNLTVTGTVTVNATSSGSQTVYAGVIGKTGMLSTVEGITGNVTVDAKSTSTSTSSYASNTVYAGGIVGNSSSWLEIGECAHPKYKVTATASSNKGTSNAYAGGIAGSASGTVIDCYNQGDITASATQTSGKANAYAGGLAGKGAGFTTSYNSGAVTATAPTSVYSGGIAGTLSGKMNGVYYKDSSSAAYTKYTGTSETAPTATKLSSLNNKNCSAFDYESVWQSGLLKAPELYPRDKVITGSVKISGTYECGNVLTADVSKVSPSDAQKNLKYQWYRGEKDSESGSVVYTAIDNATKSTYTLTAADLGKYIMLKVKGKYVKLLKMGFAGSLSVESGKTVVKKTPAKPSAPTVKSKTDTSVTLNTVSGAEYGYSKKSFISWGSISWQSGNVFTGLSPETTYRFYVRIAESDTTYQSDSSDYAEITTYKEGYDPNGISGSVTIGGGSFCGERLTADVSGLAANDSGTPKYTYQWYRGTEKISNSTSSVYTITTDDIGYTLKVVVTAGGTAKSGEPYNGVIESNGVSVSLAKVTNINASNAANGVKLSWTEVKGATSYNIYKKGTLSWSVVGTSQTNSFVVTDVKSNTEYQFDIEAVKDSVKSGYDKSGVTIKYIAQPANFTANECSANQLYLKWDAIQGASSYTVYNGTSVLKSGITGTSYKFEKLTTGTDYSLTVAAFDSDGNSSVKSSTVSVKITGSSHHSFGEPVIIKDSNCKETGSQKCTCVLCGEEKTEIIPVKPHSYDGWKQTVAPKCEENGKEQRVCSGCGRTETRDVAATGHSYGEWTVTVAPKCEEKGEEQRICSECEKTETREVAATGHSYGEWTVTVAPKCEEKGEEQRVCSECEKIEIRDVAATGHIPGEWIIDKDADVYEDGLKHSTCTECQKEYTEVIPRLAPAEVTLKSVSNGSGYVLIKWEAAEGADSYIIYRKKNTAKDWTEYDTCKTTSYKDTSVNSNSKYSYTVCGVNTSKGEYNKTGLSTLYLAPPESVKATNGLSGIYVKWSSVTGADRYVIYRKAGSGSYKKIASVSGNSTVNYTDKDVKSGTKYTYKVKAVKGDYSGATKACSARLYLKTPTVTVSNIKGGIKIKWSKTTGAKGYYIYRKTGSGEWKKIKTIKSVSTVSYKDTSVKSGKKYSYYVKAYNGKTYSSVKASSTLMFLTAAKIKSATSGKTGITVKWAKVTSAKGYYVYRKTGSGSFKKIATVKKGSTVSYLDKSAKKGTTYTYYVKAYNGSYKGYYANQVKCKDKY